MYPCWLVEPSGAEEPPQRGFLPLSILSGLLRNNGPTFLPAAVSPRFPGLAQAPGAEPLPPFGPAGLGPMPRDGSVAFQHPGPQTGNGVRDLSFQRASLRALERGGQSQNKYVCPGLSVLPQPCPLLTPGRRCCFHAGFTRDVTPLSPALLGFPSFGGARRVFPSMGTAGAV